MLITQQTFLNKIAHIKLKYSLIMLLGIFNSAIAFSQKIDSVLVGNGGGFTGHVTVYKFTSSSIKKGQGLPPVSYSSESNYKRKNFKKISAKAKQVYNNTKGFSHPYNTYKFIEIYTNGKSVKYTWGEPGFTVPNDIETLYNNLISIINSLNLNQK